MTFRLTLTASVSALLLAACSPDAGRTTEPAEPTPVPVEVPSATAIEAAPVEQATASAAPVLTANGYGPLTIGMTREAVVEAVGGPANANAASEPFACEIFHPSNAPEGLYVLLQEDKLASVYLTKSATIETAEGLKVGDTAEAVMTAYGDKVVKTPSKYLEAPAAYMTIWQSGNTSADWVQDQDARGIRFSTGTDETIEQITGGGPAIQLVEGCS
ncbi:MAG: hypothetical protein KJ871_01020 [Alphaproteobacteria bacterium]|nr:hypothetical protein [Alphaproteobacteria bacterium]MBU2083694.1 hypothetical protein [Alphaproteobacteria bacterium]MBU2143339.1 hypothetical protein [Alphaproteobacteria bacterium]MBU2195160.1 hypothetical protein [Alphaproteobacteria bacterium]